MATMIANDCINCGACEPECPNNAISQGPTIFVIDPKLCTECVGFHDYEACAAVCPVDVCVTDPNNVESEEALISRARQLHPETDFGDSFESRFRKGQGKSAAAAPAAASQTPGAPDSLSAAQTAVAVGGASAFAEADVNYVELPPIDSWNIPMRCYKCNGVHEQNVKNFTIGNVIFCPHCHKSTVVRDNLNFHIRTLLKRREGGGLPRVVGEGPPTRLARRLGARVHPGTEGDRREEKGRTAGEAARGLGHPAEAGDVLDERRVVEGVDLGVHREGQHVEPATRPTPVEIGEGRVAPAPEARPRREPGQGLPGRGEERVVGDPVRGAKEEPRGYRRPEGSGTGGDLSQGGDGIVRQEEGELERRAQQPGVWFDFSDPTTMFTDTAGTTLVSADADLIKRINSKIGTTVISENTNPPTYKVNIQNGRSVGRWDGSNDVFGISYTGAATPTMFLVVNKRTAPAAGAQSLLALHANAAIYCASGTSATDWLYYANQANATVTLTNATANAWAIISLVASSASSLVIDYNGTSVGSFDPNDAVVSGTIFHLGSAARRRASGATWTTERP